MNNTNLHSLDADKETNLVIQVLSLVTRTFSNSIMFSFAKKVIFFCHQREFFQTIQLQMIFLTFILIGSCNALYPAEYTMHLQRNVNTDCIVTKCTLHIVFNATYLTYLPNFCNYAQVNSSSILSISLCFWNVIVGMTSISDFVSSLNYCNLFEIEIGYIIISFYILAINVTRSLKKIVLYSNYKYNSEW